MTSFSVKMTVSEKGRNAPNWSFSSDISGRYTYEGLLQAIKRNLILVTDTALKDEQSRGFDKDPLIAVDGNYRKPIIQVHPLGRIEITARSEAKELILQVYSAIMRLSPVRTGMYKNSNLVFLNGNLVADDEVSLNSWLKTEPKIERKDKLRIVNAMPYARKLENRGVTANRMRPPKTRIVRRRSDNAQIVMPNGVYYLALRSLRNKFRANAFMKFQFIPGNLLPGINDIGRYSRTFADDKRPYLYPSILITFGLGTL